MDLNREREGRPGSGRRSWENWRCMEGQGRELCEGGDRIKGLRGRKGRVVGWNRRLGGHVAGGRRNYWGEGQGGSVGRWEMFSGR